MLLFHYALAALAAVFGTACIAALWSLLALQGGHPWPALLAGGSIAALLKFNGQPAGRLRALTALVLYLGAAAYAGYIEASGRIGGTLGMSLFESLRQIGGEMALAWWRAHHDGADVLWYLGGLVVAVLLGWWWGLDLRQLRRPASARR
jgi:hypothetical protein